MEGRFASRSGFTLVECMLASSLLGISCLVLFEGVGVCTRIAHENAEILAAEAIAWDAAWKRFNEHYDSLVVEESTGWQELSAAAAPALSGYDESPKLKVSVTPMKMAGWLGDMKVIEADVEWGPASNRRRLSDPSRTPSAFAVTRHEVRICRGRLGRAP